MMEHTAGAAQPMPGAAAQAGAGVSAARPGLAAAADHSHSAHHQHHHQDQAGRSPPPSTASVGPGDDDTNQDGLPACQSCRKRKLKCSREIPSCSQCLRLACECLYLMKAKPGIKTGAVESLSRRLDVLEKMLLDATGKRKPHLSFLDLDADDLGAHPIYRLGSSATSPGANGGQDHTSPATQEGSQAESASQSDGARKRQRVGEPDRSFWELEDDGPWIPALPATNILQAIVEAHFRTIHHWMPILHETRFRATLKDPKEQRRLAVLFHALVSAAIRYTNYEELGLTHEEVKRQIRISRKVVLLNAMNSLSVENVQALLFLAFDYLGWGQAEKAWAIIGSLTRTVEYLQLTVEPDDLQKQPLLRPLAILEGPRDWTESEERRRLFWSVFLLDRMCSIMSGWHTSLTSDDVHRRLPCNGGLWAREEPVSTPFFGIWDKSVAKIGNHLNQPQSLYSPLKTNDAKSVDTSKIGALAYRIEATENLSQVSCFFLQQSVNFEDREEVKIWLTRFKELDLRLVHWKMFLPQQWQESNVSRDPGVVKMDPNLTLAHLCHNTSLILLHQHVAYPPNSWRDVIKLPSSWSAETCQLAAVEVASIAQKYLRYMSGIANCQFMSCAFIAARLLLAHWRINDNDAPAPEFFNLIESLQEMSRRWQGYAATSDGGAKDTGSLDLAAKYVARLQDIHCRCLNDPSFGPVAFTELLSSSCLEAFMPYLPAKIESTPAEPPSISSSTSTSNNILKQQPYNGGQIPPIRDMLRSPSIHSPSINGSQSELPRGILPMPRPASRPFAYDLQGVRLSPAGLGSSQQQQQQQQQQQLPLVGQPPGTAGLVSGGMGGVNNGMMEPGVAGLNGHMGHDRPGFSEDDELVQMSQMLLGQQFLGMDRVITLDGTDFYYDASGRRGL